MANPNPLRGADEERKIPAIMPMRMKLVEHRRQAWFFDVPIGVLPDDLLTNAYWAHVSRSFKQCDEIIAICEDFSWYMELIVADCGVGYAKVLELRRKELTTVEPIETGSGILAGHKAEYGGTHALWRIIRESDRHVLKDKMPTKGDALAWLATYSRNVVRDTQRLENNAKTGS